jgi:hypothetical protein
MNDDWMKITCSAIMITAFVGQGEPNTNRITFTNTHGIVIKDAWITATNALDVFYATDAGPAHMKWADLPGDVQVRLGYDPAKGAVAREAAEASRRAVAAAQAEYQKAANWTGEAAKIHIVKNTGLAQYRVEILREGVDQQEIIAIPSLPREMASFIQKINELRVDLPVLQNTRVTSAALPLAQAQIADMKHDLEEMTPLEPNMTFILAAPTKLRSGGCQRAVKTGQGWALQTRPL